MPGHLRSLTTVAVPGASAAPSSAIPREQRQPICRDQHYSLIGFQLSKVYQSSYLIRAALRHCEHYLDRCRVAYNKIVSTQSRLQPHVEQRLQPIHACKRISPGQP